MAKQGGQPRKSGKQPGKAIGKNTTNVRSVKGKAKHSLASCAQRLAFLKDKFSRKFLAEAASVSGNALDNYISGERNPHQETLERIVDATGCDPGWLLTGRGEPFPTADPDTGHRLDSVRTAWASTLHLLRAAAETQHALAPLIGPTDAGTFEQLDTTADQLAAAIVNLSEFSILAHGRDLTQFSDESTVLHRRVAGTTPPTE